MSADEMTAWLRAQVEADKAAALGAADSSGNLKWFDSLVRASGDHTIRTEPGCRPVARIRLADSKAADGRTLDPKAAAAHIVIHDPRNEIADCDAKLRVLDEYESRHNDVDLMLGPPVERQRQWNGLQLAVRLLASGYRHRDGWKESWAA